MMQPPTRSRPGATGVAGDGAHGLASSARTSGLAGDGNSASLRRKARPISADVTCRVPDKNLGEFSELATGYQGAYRPARVGLTKALDAGKLRNPLHMQQRATLWNRPVTPGRRPPSRGAGLNSDAIARPRSGTRDIGSHGAALSRQRGGAEGYGQLQPQRIELPGYLNTPARRVDGEPIPPDERMTAVRKIQDLDLLTFACRRAGKLREEGRAHFSLGVLHDNLAQYQKAIKAYANFLRVCKECNDTQGCALAYHCLAVDHQLAGTSVGTSDRSGPAAAETGAKSSEDMLRKALFFHNKHRENSDPVGKFVAHLNMGLAYAALGEREASTVNHQYALRYALQLRSLEGQSLAIGSLGFGPGMYENDPDKMRVLIERYVELCDALKQTRNQAAALRKLGILASQRGEYEQSVDYFTQAMEAARTQGDAEVEKDCSVRLGIAAGQSKMSEHIGAILQQSVVQRGEESL